MCPGYCVSCIIFKNFFGDCWLCPFFVNIVKMLHFLPILSLAFNFILLVFAYLFYRAFLIYNL